MYHPHHGSYKKVVDQSDCITETSWGETNDGTCCMLYAIANCIFLCHKLWISFSTWNGYRHILQSQFWVLSKQYVNSHCTFDVFSTVHHSIELLHLPTLMHNSLFINKCMLHYYPRHVSSINMPIFRRTNCIHTASGIVALCKRLHSTPVESSLLCEYNWSSWRWAC